MVELMSCKNYVTKTPDKQQLVSDASESMKCEWGMKVFLKKKHMRKKQNGITDKSSGSVRRGRRGGRDGKEMRKEVIKAVSA